MSGFLIDTNVISELRKPSPNAGLVAWIRGTRESDLFMSVITLGELRTGVEMVQALHKRRDLNRWLVSELLPRFEDRLVAFDAETADRWGRLEVRTRARGRRMPVIDAMLAATAEHYGLTLVTRNEEDFRVVGITLVNPWR